MIISIITKNNMNKKTFSIGEALSFGWKKTTENIFFFARVAFFTIIIGFILEITAEIVFEFDSLLGLALHVISIIVTTFLYLGIMRIALNVYDNKKVSISDLFSQFNVLLPAMIAVIISIIAIAVGLIALIIPGIFILFRIYFAEMIIVDKKMNAIEALKESWRITKGNVLKLLWFAMVLLMVGILGVLALGVGIFVAMPVIWLSLAYAYRKLLEAHSSKDTEEERITEEETEKNTEEEK